MALPGALDALGAGPAVDQLASARERFVSTAARPLAFVILILGILAVGLVHVWRAGVLTWR